ncbi:hypothetical protein CRG98_044987 [Punica granatum]|uniref:Disease resistance protein RGA3 n=1 Tax=Punica granatum TaxID=22663 RepID=A0A2I0HSL4_PUNGR|nr:hypothetical protein CRG98_044987 [Punica granatum]
MADLILGSVVDSITGHLVSLISQEIGLACGVKSELKKLHTTVSIIGGVLREVDKRRIEAEDVKEWLKKLKESFYDADDLLADFSTEALRRGTVTGIGKRGLNEVRIFFSSSNQLVCAIKMAHRVRDIRERIDVIKSDRAYILLEGNNIPTLGSLVENRVRPETYPYEHETYVESFALKLWVCVSTNFHVEDILGKVLRECTPNRELTANPNMKKLGETLGEELGGKKFLLVLDDVWNEDRSKWLELQGFLMNGAKGSKILVTTRTHRVAKTMALTYHELRGLSENESLSLLMRMAMKQEHEWKNQNLEMIAKEILKKCAGVPLAIKTIGRLLLFSRNTEEDWSNFKKNDISRISQEEGDIMPTLKLSYDFLPSHLKQCFAYCSLFPKDFELEPRELVHLWMAQGFIKLQGSKKTLEEVGQDYFMELLSRSFFQDIKEDMYGNIVRCKMHDLMHDLAQYVVGDDCITVDSSHVKTFPEGARHVSILATEDYEWNGFERDRRVRSLLLMAPEPGVVYEVFPRSTAVMDWRIEIGHLDVSCFSNLRALHIRHVSIKCTHLPPLDHLPSLKRISLRHLGKLEWIELLESCATPHSTSFPSLEEIQLEFLKEFKGWERGRMKRVNIMTEQEEEEQGEDDLFMLPRFSDKVKFSLTNCPRFSCMHGRHLQLLKDVTVRPNPWTVTLSRSVSSIYLSAVTSLTIYKMEDVEHLPVELFRSLPSLASLVISECHHLKSLSGRAIHQYLPALESLEISYCEELDLSMEIDDNDDCGGGGEGIIHLQQQRQVHRKLRRITISHVHKTESLPWWFQHLSNLEYLSIKYCKGLKFLLPGRLILSLLTTLESLELMYCPELDLSTGQSEDQEDMLPDLQFDRPAKLQKLRFRCIEKMETLPWWIQHLTNLERSIHERSSDGTNGTKITLACMSSRERKMERSRSGVENTNKEGSATEKTDSRLR